MQKHREKLALIIAAVVIIPIGINILCYIPMPERLRLFLVGSPTDWLEFFGNYLGAAIAFVTLYYTIQSNHQETISSLRYSRELSQLQEFNQVGGEFIAGYVSTSATILNNLSSAENYRLLNNLSYEKIYEQLDKAIHENNTTLSKFLMILPSSKNQNVEDSEFRDSILNKVFDINDLLADCCWIVGFYTNKEIIDFKSSILKYKSAEISNKSHQNSVKRIWDITKDYSDSLLQDANLVIDSILSSLSSQVNPTELIDTIRSYSEVLHNRITSIEKES